MSSRAKKLSWATSRLSWKNPMIVTTANTTVVEPVTTPGFEEDPVFVSENGNQHNFLPITRGRYLTRGYPSSKYSCTPELKNTACCGIKEMFGIDYGWSAEQMLALIVEWYGVASVYGYKRGEYQVRMLLKTEQFLSTSHPYFIFSSGKRKAKEMVAVIEECKLGEVTVFGPNRNPTGSPTLEMGVFIPNKEALLAWYLDQRVQLGLDEVPEDTKKKAA